MMIEIEKLEKIQSSVRDKYSKFTKIFLFLSVLFIIWIVFVALGIGVFELGHNWAMLSLEAWIYAASVVFIIFIVLEIFFYLHYSNIQKRKIELKRPKPQFLDGRRLHIFTNPQGAEGGIFSKTYIDIDEKTILRLRSLMIRPEELWGKKEEEK